MEGSEMTKLSFKKKLIVARVLNRYVEQSAYVDYNKAVLSALEKWISQDSVLVTA
jgi:hypothetical protein